MPRYQSEKGATSYVVRHLEPAEERQKPQRTGETQRAVDCEELLGLWARQKLRQGRSNAEDVSTDVSEFPVIVYVAMREERCSGYAVPGQWPAGPVGLN